MNEEERLELRVAMEEYLQKRYVIAGTGSRSYQRSPESDEWIKEQLGSLALNKVGLPRRKHGTNRLAIMSGGAQGWDTAIARAAYQLELPYVMVIPSPDYGPYYWKEDIGRFNRMLEHARRVEYTCATHQNGRANFIRNQRMVNLADAFLVYDAGSPGTKDCVARIKRAAKPYRVLEG